MYVKAISVPDTLDQLETGNPPKNVMLLIEEQGHKTSGNWYRHK